MATTTTVTITIQDHKTTLENGLLICDGPFKNNTVRSMYQDILTNAHVATRVIILLRGLNSDFHARTIHSFFWKCMTAEFHKLGTIESIAILLEAGDPSLHTPMWGTFVNPPPVTKSISLHVLFTPRDSVPKPSSS